MKSAVDRFIAAFVIGLFVNFVFSNTVFIHSHLYADGHRVTHSHPFQPASPHTHNSVSLDQIAGFNLSASAFDGSALLSMLAGHGIFIILTPHSQFKPVSDDRHAYGLRDPPPCA